MCLGLAPNHIFCVVVWYNKNKLFIIPHKKTDKVCSLSVNLICCETNCPIDFLCLVWYNHIGHKKSQNIIYEHLKGVIKRKCFSLFCLSFEIVKVGKTKGIRTVCVGENYKVFQLYFLLNIQFYSELRSSAPYVQSVSWCNIWSDTLYITPTNRNSFFVKMVHC